MSADDFAELSGDDDAGGEEFFYSEPSREMSTMMADDPQMAIQRQLLMRPRSLTADEAMEKMRADVKNVTQVLAWSDECGLLLLRQFKWNTERAKEGYFDRPDALLKEIGVEDGSPNTLKRGPPGACIECGVCWDDRPGPEVGALGCGHWVCIPCWAKHLRFQLKTRGKDCIGTCRCPQKGCKKTAGESVFIEIFGAAGPERKQYRGYLLDSYVGDHDHLSWCPAPSACPLVVFVPTGRQPDQPCQPVKCSCGHTFCFLCKHESHPPATCDMMKRWLKKERDESENATWMAANTKLCPAPNCGRATEKNGGCNHMTCSQCKHEWCWVCSGDWSKHGSSYYKCNYYVEGSDKNETKRNTARAELHKYTHYYTRYRNHEQSKKLDAGVLSTVRQRMERELRETQRALSEVDYLEDTAVTLIACRHMLKYSYVYAYYLDDERGKELFEYNQSHLEYSTELLSEFIEDRNKKFEKTEVVNRTSTAKQMLRNLSEGKYRDPQSAS